MKLSPQQFSSQVTLPGMEHLAPEPEAVPQRHSGDAWYLNRGKPVGMRGSAQDRLGLPAREQRRSQNRERLGSYRMRVEDEGFDSDYETAEKHPRTGLPAWGSLDTHEDLGMSGPNMPPSLHFHSSAASARRAHSHVEEVPLYNAPNREFIGTPQGDVSSQRVHQALEDPSTTQSPRFHGRSIEELPHVFHNKTPWDEDYTVIDGNHRTAAHLLSGQMFMKARVLTREDVPAVEEHSKRIAKAMGRAMLNENRNPDAERLLDEKYGID